MKDHSHRFFRFFIFSFLVILLSCAGFSISGADSDMSGDAGITNIPYDHPGIVLGAHIPPVDPTFGPGRLYYWEDINAFYEIAGKRHPIIMYYSDLTSGLNPYLFNQFRDKMDPSPIPYVQVDPQSGQTLTQIANGQYDSQLRERAGYVADFGKPILIGFAHEFNGSYTDYFGDPNAYIAAFRHMVDLFDQEGATNVQWVWPPNYASDVPEHQYSDYNLYYPGDEYVDWIGVYGFNWGTETSWSPGWVSFDHLFHDFLVDTACRYRKPQLVLTASVSGGGSKTEWIQQTYNIIQQYPSLRAIVWFNDYAYSNQGQPDFRVTATSLYGDGPGELPPFTETYAEAIDDPFFLDTMLPYQDLEPYSKSCFTIEAQPKLRVVCAGESTSVSVEFQHAPAFSSPVTLTIVDLPQGISGTCETLIPTVGTSYSNCSLDVADWVTPGLYDLTIQADGGGAQEFEEFDTHVVPEMYRAFLPIAHKNH